MNEIDEKRRKALQCLSAKDDRSLPNGSCRVSSEDVSEIELLDAYSRAVVTVVDAVGPAVVGIKAKGSLSGPGSEEGSVGSGVLIAPDGYLLTNDHVVQGVQKVEVTLQDGTNFSAALIGTDPATDLAASRAESSGLPYATLAGR
jgi:S1-C subfamily serine protease